MIKNIKSIAHIASRSINIGDGAVHYVLDDVIWNFCFPCLGVPAKMLRRPCDPAGGQVQLATLMTNRLRARADPRALAAKKDPPPAAAACMPPAASPPRTAHQPRRNRARGQPAV